MKEKKRTLKTYTISEVARELGISTVWLRKGEVRGFFPPARRDPTNGYRYYSRKDVERLKARRAARINDEHQAVRTPSGNPHPRLTHRASEPRRVVRHPPVRLVGGEEHLSGEGAAQRDPSVECRAEAHAEAEVSMKDLRQWVCWRSEARERDGKLTKVPYSPRSGLRARSDDPETWGKLAQAEEAAEKERHDGIGFVFTEEDPFCGLDLDSCVDPKTGEIESWAKEILEELDSYAEFSPSGRGLHIIVRAKLPPGGNRKGRLEMYDRGRFFTVTRRRLPGTSRRIEDRQKEVEALARSGLNREKWNREDYRRRTISRALAGTTGYYMPRGSSLELSSNGHLPDPEAPGFVGAALGLSSALPQAAEFPVEAMPAPCRRLVEEAMASLGCAPELAALSSATGASRVVEVKGGWREGATLFLAVVASPGAMKTPAAKVAKKPVFERQRELGRAYAEDKEDWKRELREWEVEKRDAAKAGEPAPEQPEAPSMGRSVASDTTVEALVSILEANPRGVLVHKD
jgi:hypothetical protein